MTRLAMALVVCGLAACGAEIVSVEGEPAGSAAPIASDDGQWTWVPFEDAVCANGETTGMGINKRSDSNTLVIYLQGGGACWDGASCYGPLSSATAVQSGYDFDSFQREPNLLGIHWLQRDVDENAFRGFSYVFVPYCTGDVHAGVNVAEHPWLGSPRKTHHVGARNLEAYLRRIAATFPDVERVFLMGASAGGFGTLMNVSRVQERFPGVRIDVVNDSGPPIKPEPDRMAAWLRAWKMEWPADCHSCDEEPGALVEHIAAAHPATKVALLAYRNDGVVAHFADVTTDAVGEQMDGLRGRFKDVRGWATFVVDGTSHVVIADPLAEVDGLRWTQWLAQLVDDDDSWGGAGSEAER